MDSSIMYASTFQTSQNWPNRSQTSLKKNKQFIWSEDQMRSFNKFKELLASSPVRHIYDHNKHCELHTDASTIGIAGILIQDSHPIGYYSRKLSDAETRYTATELECLAVHDSIKYFRIY